MKRIRAGKSIAATLTTLIVAIVLAVMRGQTKTSPSSVPPATPANRSAPEQTAASPRESAGQGSRNGGFRSQQALRDHFEKHGREFGRNVSVDEYLRLARGLRDAPVGRDVVEAIRADGVITRFDRRGGAFGAFNRDGTIRTFFRPNDGEAYFRRQLEREDDP